MKKLITSILILSALAASALTLTGCDENKTPVTHTSLVLGVHENFPMPSPTAFHDQIYSSAYSGGKLHAVVADGNADTLSFETEYEITPNDMNDTKKQKAEADTNSTVFQLLGIYADAPESDLLQAITTSANTLKGYEGWDKKMYVCDSGLSTCGLLDFTDPALINTDPKELVDRLRQLSALPELDGVDVEWLGLGQTCGDQTPLSASFTAKLKAIWQEVLVAGGAKVSFNDAPVSDGRNSFDLPDCSTVEVSVDVLLPSDTDTSVDVIQQDTPAE